MTETFDDLTPKERRLIRGVKKRLNQIWQDKAFVTPNDIDELLKKPTEIIDSNILDQLNNKDPRRLVNLAIYGIHPSDDSSQEFWKRNLFVDDAPHTSPKDVLLWALRQIHPSQEQAVIDALDEISPGLAKELEYRSEPFEFLLKFDKYAIRQILREVDTRQLGFALINAAPEIKILIYSNMSKRAAEMLEGDIQCMGKLHETIILRAQKRIMEIARRLIEEGEIVEGADGSCTVYPAPSTDTDKFYSDHTSIFERQKSKGAISARLVLLFKLVIISFLTLLILVLVALVSWKVAQLENKEQNRKTATNTNSQTYGK